MGTDYDKPMGSCSSVAASQCLTITYVMSRIKGELGCPCDKNLREWFDEQLACAGKSTSKKKVRATPLHAWDTLQHNPYRDSEQFNDCSYYITEYKTMCEDNVNGTAISQLTNLMFWLWTDIYVDEKTEGHMIELELSCATSYLNKFFELVDALDEDE